MTQASDLIAQLKLEPHPEGGWYRETWRALTEPGERASSTAIHFLLEAGQQSRWHHVDAAEIWLWHAGDALALDLSESDEGPVRRVVLGADICSGQQVQQVVRPQEWQSARPLDGDAGFSLVSCVVAPGFEFDRFVMAPEDWAPGSGASEN